MKNACLYFQYGQAFQDSNFEQISSFLSHSNSEELQESHSLLP
uniref:Ferritin-like diiron domain-containing protein n=1 Tax=Podoviridae sp. ctrTt13 TaxID=2825279 RepID=A0A8S5NTJ9_9CAUD|nr:MAG TPA: hypothetical protein [Podoviridae sp. ctrTt13]